MNPKNSLILTILTLLITTTAKTQTTYTIYYQNSYALYGITDLSTEPTLVVSVLPETVSFSNSGRYVAYKNSEGIWISRTDTWSPEIVLSTLPQEAFSLYWTPDDTRLILRLAFWHEDINPVEQPLAYNLLTETSEAWIWRSCDQIAQHRLTRDFALICEAYENMPTHEINAIVLEWGGDYSEYDPDQYEILRNGLIDSFPRPFDWGTTQTQQNMVYTAYTADYHLKIISLWNDGDGLEISDFEQPGLENWFSVSDDRSMVAYTVFCGNPSDSCLEIANLHTGEIIWGYEDTIRIETVQDIEWYPDNQQVALLGSNYIDYQWREFVQVFNIETGDNVSINVENTTGVIVVN
jgi:hypothetical protein